MNKPITYWIDTDHIQNLCDRFGPTLDGYEETPGLTNREKISLRCVLSGWTALQYVDPTANLCKAFEYIEAAWEEACVSEHGLCSEDVIEALKILEGITTSQANEIIRALSESIKSINQK